MRVEIARSAQREMERLLDDVLARVRSRILGLADNPRPRDSKKLALADAYRIRTGDYRIIYTVDLRERKVTIIAVRHRREAYK